MRRTVQAPQVNNNLFTGFNPVFWADAYFVKNFTKFDLMSPEKQQKLALILCDIYKPFYLAMRALMAFNTKIGTTYEKQYPALLN